VNKPLIVGLFLSVGLGLGVAAALITPNPKANQAIEWLDNPRNLAAFNLTNETGAFDSHSLLGRWTIVQFGFLNCPDICPTSLAQLATFASAMNKRSSDEEITYIFVSVDPNRDSVEQVSEYVRRFSPSIEGVTGSPEQLAQFAGDLGIQFKVSADPEDYAVAHSITYSIIDPDGVLRGRFRPGFNITDLVSSFVAHLG